MQTNPDTPPTDISLLHESIYISLCQVVSFMCAQNQQQQQWQQQNTPNADLLRQAAIQAIVDRFYVFLGTRDRSKELMNDFLCVCHYDFFKKINCITKNAKSSSCVNFGLI